MESLQRVSRINRSLPPNRRVLYEKLRTERWINRKYMQASNDAHSFGA